ncbi:ATPdependent RNA helicase [Terramyces sp. JEL0728]|nr:ATPdependent RNA helicase [Terramyces sp. JEL0728]
MFWKPGSNQGEERKERDRRDDSKSSGYNDYRKSLPIYKSKDQLLYLIEKYQVSILVGGSQSGKETQLPQYLYESGYCDGYMIGCTQRQETCIASYSKASAEVNESLAVGYAVPFDESFHPTYTKIKYLTAELLFREALKDPLLSAYSVIIIDQITERKLYTDLLLSILKKIIKKRPDLKIILYSSSSDIRLFFDYFNVNTTVQKENDSVIVLSLEGRSFPVQDYYITTPCSDYIQETVNTVLKLNDSEKIGDILVFLSSREEVDTVIELINEFASDKKYQLTAVAIDGVQKHELQPIQSRTRTVMISCSNETFSIDGVSLVIDVGFIRMPIYHPKDNLEYTHKMSVSKSIAIERSIMAGKTRPGKCIRLYTEKSFGDVLDSEIPEIQRVDFTLAIIHLKSLGIENILGFDFISNPSPEILLNSFDLLHGYQYLDSHGRLLPAAILLLELPFDLKLSTMLLAAEKYSCTEEIATIIALLLADNVFLRPKEKQSEADEARNQFAVQEGDLLSLINVYQSFIQGRKSAKWCHANFVNHKVMNHAVGLRTMICKLLKRLKIPIKSCGSNLTSLRKCILSAYFPHAARLRSNGSYITIKGQKILELHPSSFVFDSPPDWVVFYDIQEVGSKTYMNGITQIDSDWLSEIAPNFFESKTNRTAF